MQIGKALALSFSCSLALVVASRSARESFFVRFGCSLCVSSERLVRCV